MICEWHQLLMSRAIELMSNLFPRIALHNAGHTLGVRIGKATFDLERR
jgi:hypothetical protein